MEAETFERPADLAVWSAGLKGRLLGERTRFRSLREAITAAASHLSDPAKQPWITTEDGEMLAPSWIRGQLS